MSSRPRDRFRFALIGFVSVLSLGTVAETPMQDEDRLIREVRDLGKRLGPKVIARAKAEIDQLKVEIEDATEKRKAISKKVKDARKDSESLTKTIQNVTKVHYDSEVKDFIYEVVTAKPLKSNPDVYNVRLTTELRVPADFWKAVGSTVTALKKEYEGGLTGDVREEFFLDLALLRLVSKYDKHVEYGPLGRALFDLHGVRKKEPKSQTTSFKETAGVNKR